MKKIKDFLILIGIIGILSILIITETTGLDIKFYRWIKKKLKQI